MWSVPFCSDFWTQAWDFTLSHYFYRIMPYHIENSMEYISIASRNWDMKPPLSPVVTSNTDSL